LLFNTSARIQKKDNTVKILTKGKGQKKGESQKQKDVKFGN